MNKLRSCSRGLVRATFSVVLCLVVMQGNLYASPDVVDIEWASIWAEIKGRPPQECVQILEETLPKIKPNTPAEALALFWLGDSYRKLDLTSQSVLALEKSLVLFEALGTNEKKIELALLELGIGYSAQARFDEAEKLFRRILLIEGTSSRPIDSKESLLPLTLNELASVFAKQSRYKEAEDIYRRLLPIDEKRSGNESLDYSSILHNMANVLRKSGPGGEAESLYKQALAIREKAQGPNSVFVANTLIGLANLYGSQGKHQEAQALVQRAIGIYERQFGSNSTKFAMALNNLAIELADSGQFDQAEATFTKALHIQEADRSQDIPAIENTLFNLAKLEFDKGRTAEAEPWAIRGAHMLANRLTSAGLDEDIADLKSHQKDFRLLLGILAALPPSSSRLDEAFSSLQLARASNTAQAVTQMAARFASGENAVGKIIREQQDLAARRNILEKQWTTLISAPASDRNLDKEKALRALIASLEARSVNVASEIAMRFPAYANLVSSKPVGLDDVKPLLRADEALLAWIFAREEAYLFVLRRNEARLVRLPVSVDKIIEQVKALRKDVAFPGVFSVDIAYQLYQELVEPSVEMLREVSHVYVVPSGPLESLPLSLLLTAPVKDAVAGKVTDPHTLKDAPWLIRKWAISTLPSVASLRALRMLAKDSKATKPFIGIGDPQLTDQPIDKAPRRDTANFKLAALYRGSLANVTQLKALPSLPDTAFELRRIAGYLGAGPDALLLRDNATETRVKAARLFDARVVAFSTHGILGGELTGMAEPALVLTPPARATELDDGLLTSSEIAQLKLDADLVILSACNTAGSDGSPGAEGLSGLARAFIYAGARNLLVSHWPVSSGAATMLTTRMMQESTKPHVRFAEAHRRAMVAFLDETDNSDLSRNENAMKSHPAYWAPFSLVGD